MTILPLTYFGPISWWKILTSSQNTVFDIHENYIKQTYRNRCTILSANGKLNLSIPVKKILGNHTPLKEIKIENNQSWQKTHERAVMSAYKASPYYDYLINDINEIWSKEYNYLIDICLDSIEIVSKITKSKPEYILSEKYINAEDDDNDYRKIKNYAKIIAEDDNEEYYQVFNDRFNFIADLSILDKIFNTNSL